MSCSDVTYTENYKDAMESYKEDLYQMREKWLQDNSIAEHNICEDENGEYCFLSHETDHSDDYDVKIRKHYLTDLGMPAYLSKEHIDLI